jgi:fucose permease
MGLMAMILSSTGLALPRLQEEIGLSSVQQGSLVSIQYIGFTVAVLLGGTLADKIGKLRLLSITFGILGVAAVLFGAASSYWMTVLGVLLIGSFGSIAQNGITALATNYDKNNAEKNNAFVQLFFTVGAVLTPVLLLIFLLSFNEWRYAYYIVAALCMVIALVTSRYKEEKKASQSSLASNLGTYVKALKTPSYLIAPMALFLYVGAEIGIWGFAPIFFEGQGYGRISGILSSILIWLSMLLGRSISVRLLKKYDMTQILIVHGILAVIALTLVIFSGQTASIIWISVSGFACAPFYPLIVTWMTRLTGDNSSNALAFTMAFGSLGAVVLGWVIGLVVDHYGAKYITVAPAFAFVAVILLLIIFRKKRVQM